MSGAVDLGEVGEEEGEETDMDTGRVGRRPCQRMMRAVAGETVCVETKTITDDDAHLWAIWETILGAVTGRRRS